MHRHCHRHCHRHRHDSHKIATAMHRHMTATATAATAHHRHQVFVMGVRGIEETGKGGGLQLRRSGQM